MKESMNLFVTIAAIIPQNMYIYSFASISHLVYFLLNAILSGVKSYCKLSKGQELYRVGLEDCDGLISSHFQLSYFTNLPNTTKA